jgi:hypothetical protein
MKLNHEVTTMGLGLKTAKSAATTPSSMDFLRESSPDSMIKSASFHSSRNSLAARQRG